MRGSILVLILAALMAGCATSPNGRLPTAELRSAEADDENAHATRLVTGSRIRQRVAQDGRVYPHSSSPVVVYGRDELERSGEPDAAEALRLLHPFFY